MNNQNRFLVSVVCLLASLLGFGQAPGQRIYVASVSSAGAMADGKSWQSAYPSLQQALSKANRGDSIWLAQGTYTPTTSSDRTIAFNLPTGVKLFGGFRGMEQHLKDRNWDLYPSILSGRIGGAENFELSSFHVLTLLNVDSTIIDGVVIEGGLANVQSPNAAIPSSNGGGILIVNEQQKAASIVIHNVVFRRNFAIRGGGIAILENTLNLRTVLQIENCTFETNSAQFGGAIYTAIFNSSSKLAVHKSHFVSNRAQAFAAVMYHTFSGQVEFTHCISKENECQGTSILRMESTNDPITIRDCEFNAESFISGGIIDVLALGSPSAAPKTPHQITILKNQFLNSKSNDGGAVFVVINSSVDHVNLTIEDCKITKSGSSLGANGVHVEKKTAFSQVDCAINRCVFEDNRIYGKQFGIIDFINFAGKGNPLKGNISNCLFYKNAGPVVYASQYSDGEIQLNVVNSTFFGDRQGDILRNARTANSQISIHLQNSIFYNQQTTLIPILQNTAGTNLQGFSFNHCLFSASSCVSTGDITGCGTGNIFGSYPQFIDSSNVQGLKLAPGSIAINAGRWHPELTALDLLGQNRVQDCQPDLGAYESPSLLSLEDTLQVKAQVRSTPVNMSVGEIAIQQISGGFPPYRIRWENGDSTSVRSNLATGQYTLTISDQMGCFKVYTYTVPFTTSTNESEQRLEKIYFSPNPQHKDQHIRLHYENLPPGQWQVKIIDLSGRLIYQQHHLLQTNGVLNFAERLNLRAGMYLITLSNEGNSLSTKLMIAQ